MALTQAQKARLALEIDRFRQEADVLEKKANSEEEMFFNIARTYGSELAGPPSIIGTNRKKAASLRKDADFLETVKEGRRGTIIFLTSYGREYLKAGIEKLIRKIEELNLDKKVLETRLEDWEKVFKVISD